MGLSFLWEVIRKAELYRPRRATSAGRGIAGRGRPEAARKAGLDRSALVERPKFHDLRHSYATWLISEGVLVTWSRR